MLEIDEQEYGMKPMNCPSHAGDVLEVVALVSGVADTVRGFWTSAPLRVVGRDGTV